jgi:hypothetical protein
VSSKRRRLLIFAAVSLATVCLFPKSEYTIELDGVNLRMRECSRYRSWLLGIQLWERCGVAWDHPTAARLRELGALAPVSEDDAHWVLVKGFTSGVRGWTGPGRHYVVALGASSFGTPVTLPAEENISQNVWIRLAEKDAEEARRFWLQFQSGRARTASGGAYLWTVREYLNEHGLEVKPAELDEHVRRALGE